MAKTAERVNWKALAEERAQHMHTWSERYDRLLRELDVMETQFAATGKQLADTGRERDALQGRLTLAIVTLKGAAEVVRAHNPDLAAALYAQADAL